MKAAVVHISCACSNTAPHQITKNSIFCFPFLANILLFQQSSSLKEVFLSAIQTQVSSPAVTTALFFLRQCTV